MTSCTVCGEIIAGMPRLTAFQNTMPWVMIAPFGMARGARGVHDHADVVVRQRHRRRHRRARRQRALVGAGRVLGIDLEQVLRQRRGLLREALVVDQELGRRIAQDVVELRHGEPPVERQHDRAEPAAGELELEVFGAVGREQRHAVALADALRREPAGELVGAAMQLGIGERPVGLQVVDRELLRAGDRRGGRSSRNREERQASLQFTAFVKPFQ